MQLSVILAICNLVALAILVWFMFDNLRRTNDLMDELNKSMTRELKLVNQQGRLMEIIINAKKKKEIYIETLEKIEKELFG